MECKLVYDDYFSGVSFYGKLVLELNLKLRISSFGLFWRGRLENIESSYSRGDFPSEFMKDDFF